MTPDELVQAFVRAMLDTPRATTGTKAGRKTEAVSNPPQQMPLGLSPEQVVDLIDRRVGHIIAQGDASAADLSAMTPGWLSADEMHARQERTNGTYRPDGDYPDGEAGATMPWIAPLR